MLSLVLYCVCLCLCMFTCVVVSCVRLLVYCVFVFYVFVSDVFVCLFGVVGVVYGVIVCVGVFCCLFVFIKAWGNEGSVDGKLLFASTLHVCVLCVYGCFV